jgi:hypothetical protein
MRSRYRAAAFAAALCVVAAANAWAQRPAPVHHGSIAPGTPIVRIREEASLPACQVGITGPVTDVIGYILPPDDAYYTLMSASECPECAGEPRLYTFVHLGLFWVYNCQVPVTISIVAATGESCPFPDPSTVLCPPVTYTLDAVELGVPFAGAVDVMLPLAASCCLEGDAFLRVEYDQGTCNFTNFGFLTEPVGCSRCRQYNIWPGGTDDLCSILSQASFGLLVQKAEAECCGETAVEASTIGQVKTLYR